MAALKDVGVEIARETRMNLTDITPDSVVHSFAIYIISLSFIGETTENAVAEFSTCTGPKSTWGTSTVQCTGEAICYQMLKDLVGEILLSSE